MHYCALFLMHSSVGFNRLGTDPHMRVNPSNEEYFFLYKINKFIVENFPSKAH